MDGKSLKEGFLAVKKLTMIIAGLNKRKPSGGKVLKGEKGV